MIENDIKSDKRLKRKKVFYEGKLIVEGKKKPNSFDEMIAAELEY